MSEVTNAKEQRSKGEKGGGMGATPYPGGVGFRVWAPHARLVSVIGAFNDWNGAENPMRAEANGNWSADVPGAKIGDPYKFLLSTEMGELKRIDPYAREVTGSTGDAVVHDPSFSWDDDFHMAPWNELVIYELHVGTFNDQEDDDAAAQFGSISARLGHLKKMGVNAIQIMPVGEFAGDRSWGYNPAHIFSVELSYGGPLAFKRFVKRAHSQGGAVILDVVYNHLGPSDLDLWQFDGWSENGLVGLFSGCATMQTWPDSERSAESKMGVIQNNIGDGLKTGALSPDQSQMYLTTLKGIRTDYEGLRDKVVLKEEWNRLHARLDTLGAEINAAVARTTTMEGPRNADRIVTLQKRIDDGRISGRLSPTEEREFQARLDSIRRDYLRMTEGGRSTTYEERSDLSRRLDFLETDLNRFR